MLDLVGLWGPLHAAGFSWGWMLLCNDLMYIYNAERAAWVSNNNTRDQVLSHTSHGELF
jgi:hypothetical protein